MTGRAQVIGLIGMAAIWTARAMVTFGRQVYFDLDPAINPFPIGGFGPAGSLWLDIGLLLSCAVALVGELRAGRGISLFMFVLAAVPAGAVIVHGVDDAGDLWRGVTFATAAVSLVTVAHLVRDRSLRALVLVLLLATMAPVIARGVMQVTVEHDATLADFERSGETFLAQRGWAPESPQAKIYKRRLAQRSPLGWFPTTNIFAALMAFGLIVGTAVTAASIRSSSPSGWSGAGGMMTAMCALGLVLAGSKGAFAVALLGMMLVVPLLMRPALLGRFATRAGLVAVGIVALALAGIAVRGVLLPEGFLGDRSLLFRWHYLQGALRMVPEHWLIGVGPDGFQDAYVQVRSPRSPEEVTSAHSMFVDWMAMLGLMGVPLVMLVGRQLLQAGRLLSAEPDSDEREAGTIASPRSVMLISAVVMAVALLISMPPQFHVLDLRVTFVVLIGCACGVLAAGLVAAVYRIEPTTVALGMFVATTVLVIHGQIEMTFYQPSAVVWAMCAVGALAPAPALRPGRTWICPAVLALTGGIILFIGAWPATAQQRLIAEAAAALAPPPTLHDQALLNRAASPEILDTRLRAIGLLEDAYELWPSRDLPLYAALMQIEYAAGVSDQAERGALLDRAVMLANRIVTDHRSNRALVARIEQSVGRSMHGGGTSDLDQAIEDAREVAGNDPCAVASWTRLGDLFWLHKQPADAAASYRRALQNSDAFELDPLKQLPGARRRQLEDRIDPRVD